MNGTRIGIDIGGTFTDFLLFDGETGRFSIAKTLTTPDEPARAVSTGIEQLSGQTGIAVEQVEQIVHGTTLVTNALIERKGAVTALITTKGFRDALEIAREHRYDLYDLFLEPPAPLAPRYLRMEMDERILSDGSVATPVDLDELPALVDTIRREGATADGRAQAAAARSAAPGSAARTAPAGTPGRHPRFGRSHPAEPPTPRNGNQNTDSRKP